MSRSTGAVVSLTGKIKTQTTKAICFICDPETIEFETEVQVTENLKGLWFPFSQVTEIHTGVPEQLGDFQPQVDRLVVTQWIAKQKGIVT